MRTPPAAHGIIASKADVVGGELSDHLFAKRAEDRARFGNSDREEKAPVFKLLNCLGERHVGELEGCAWISSLSAQGRMLEKRHSLAMSKTTMLTYHKGPHSHRERRHVRVRRCSSGQSRRAGG